MQPLAKLLTTVTVSTPHTHTYSQLIFFANTKLPLTQFIESNHKTFVQLFIEDPASPTMYQTIPSPTSTLYTLDKLYSQINFTSYRVSTYTIYTCSPTILCYVPYRTLSSVKIYTRFEMRTPYYVEHYDLLTGGICTYM